MSRNPSIPDWLTGRDVRAAQRLVTKIQKRLRIASMWAGRAVWDVENDLLRHKISLLTVLRIMPFPPQKRWPIE